MLSFVVGKVKRRKFNFFYQQLGIVNNNIMLKISMDFDTNSNQLPTTTNAI